MNQLIINGINYQARTYYDTLRRLYKGQNNAESTRKMELSELRIKRDQRTRTVRDMNINVDFTKSTILTPCQVWSKLVSEAILKEVNTAVELATQELGLPRLLVMADDIPFEALSDLESDPEGVPDQTKLEYLKRAHLDRIDSVKWMSWKKMWTSEPVSQHPSPCSMKTTYIYMCLFLSLRH